MAKDKTERSTDNQRGKIAKNQLIPGEDRDQSNEEEGYMDRAAEEEYDEEATGLPMGMYSQEEKLLEEEYMFQPRRGEDAYSRGKEEPWGGGSQWTWGEGSRGHYVWEGDQRARAPAEEGSRKKARFRVCTNCGTTTTPSWRRSTNNKLLLCNACGLYQKLHGSDRPYSVTADGKTKAIKTSSERGVCRGCGAAQTPLWRRGYSNEWLCGSCGLLYGKRKRAEDEYAGKSPGRHEEWSPVRELPAQERSASPSPLHGQPIQHAAPRPYPQPPEEYGYPSEWAQYGRNRGQYLQYSYDDASGDDEYFSSERFKGYGGYYDEEEEDAK